MPVFQTPARAGQLRHRVTIQTPAVTTDPYGQSQPTWENLGTYYASVKPLSGREKQIASAIRDDISHLVTMRYQPSQTFYPIHRILYGTRTFNIGAVINVDEKNHTLLIYCTESGLLPSTTGNLIYWGASASTTLDGAGVLALDSSATLVNWQVIYSFTAVPSEYKYIAIPATLTISRIIDPNSGFGVALATPTQGYTSGDGPFYQTVAVNSINYNVYRSLEQLGGNVDFLVS